MKEKFSKDVQEKLDNFKACEQEVTDLQARIESSLKTKERLRSDLNEIEQLKAKSVYDRKAIAARFAAGEVDEDEVAKVRKGYAELSEQIDQKDELITAVDRVLTDAQNEINDAQNKLWSAKQHVFRGYRIQLQQEIRDQCGDKLLHAWAAWFGSGGHAGINGIGFFANELLLIDDQDDGLRSPNYEEINQVRSEVYSGPQYLNRRIS